LKPAQLAPALLIAVLLTFFMVDVAFASPTGYAVYSVSLTLHGSAESLTVNESLSPTSSSGIDTLVLQLLWQGASLNYSRSVNSSLNPFPFVPSVANQSLAFGNGTSRVSVHLLENGTTPVTFQGGRYTLSSLSFSAQFFTGKSRGTLSGTLTAFPSGLVYSLRADVNGTSSLDATLRSTSLPLTSGGSSSALQMASVGLGAGAAISVLAVSLGIRSRRHRAETARNKPDYWVD